MTDNTKSAQIIGFVSEPTLITQIENSLQSLDFQIKWIKHHTDIGQQEAKAKRETPGESLQGQKGQLFVKITDWQPALILFDLNNDAIPWRQWIPILKSSPATRRMPIICFDLVEDQTRLQNAKNAGAVVAITWSDFITNIVTLVKKWARLPNYVALQNACQEPLSALAIEGIELFNDGQYYECHEALEHAWMADKGAGRELYRGMLQVGIAYLQIERGNYRGAVKMLLRVRQWLDPLPATCRGVDIVHLRRNVQQAQQALTELGPERINEWDQALFQPIQYK